VTKGIAKAMSNDNVTGRTDKTQSVELGLLEWNSADRAGVFRATEYSAVGLERRSDRCSPPLFQSRRFWVPFAAAAMVAFGVGTAMFTLQLRSLRPKAGGEVLARSSSASNAPGFAECLNGPGVAASPECVKFDFDSDRDVDLIDYGYDQRVKLAAGN